MSGERQRAQIARNLPEGWPRLFGPVPGGRSGKVRCLLCGAMGYDGQKPFTAFDGRAWPGRPSPWQLSCIGGHPYRCEVCRRPFASGTGLASHQRCKLHHDCCLRHTTVPEWKNPFRRAR